MEPAEDPEEESSLAETDAIDGAHGTPKDSEVSRLSFKLWLGSTLWLQTLSSSN